jgi:Protein of unknown function (DUF3093)
VAHYRYEERMWVPWWVYALVFGISGGFFALVGLAADARGLSLLLLGVGFGVWMTLLIWWSTARRRIRVDDRYADFGYGDRVDLRFIDETQPVSGAAVGRIRRRLLDHGAGAGVAGASMLAGRVGHAFGQIGLGLSSLRSLGRRRGAVCPAWMRTAVHVTVLPGSATAEWLVGTRHPDELALALREAADAASSRYLAQSEGERFEQAVQQEFERGS